MEDNPGLFSGTCSRVLHIAPPSATDAIELIGLNITGGDGKGAAAYISEGRIVFSRCNIYNCNGAEPTTASHESSGKSRRHDPIVVVASGDVTFSRCNWYRTGIFDEDWEGTTNGRTTHSYCLPVSRTMTFSRVWGTFFYPLSDKCTGDAVSIAEIRVSSLSCNLRTLLITPSHVGKHIVTFCGLIK